MVTHVRGLDQVAEGNAQGFGDAVERRQADVLLAGLDGHQHAPADPGLFRKRSLAKVGGVAQATNVLADVLQDRSPLRIFFVHYIAQWVGVRSILPSVRRIVRSVPFPCKTEPT